MVRPQNVVWIKSTGAAFYEQEILQLYLESLTNGGPMSLQPYKSTLPLFFFLLPFPLVT